MNENIKICKNCRKPFRLDNISPLAQRRKYCSIGCKLQYRSRKFRIKHPNYQKEHYFAHKKIKPVKICKYPDCKAILSKYNKDTKYCLLHQRKFAQEEIIAEEERKLTKSKRWKQLTWWKPFDTDSEAGLYYRFILQNAPRGMYKLIKRKNLKIHKQYIYAVFVRTQDKGIYLHYFKQVYVPY